MPTITMLDSDGSNPSTSGTAASRLAGELTRTRGFSAGCAPSVSSMVSGMTETFL